MTSYYKHPQELQKGDRIVFRFGASPEPQKEETGCVSIHCGYDSQLNEWISVYCHGMQRGMLPAKYTLLISRKQIRKHGY